MGKVFGKHFRIICKIVIIFAFLVIFINLSTQISNSSEAANDSSYIVMRADTMEVICGDNIHKRLPMASTTKVMTALVVIENVLPDEIVTIGDDSVGIEGSSIYLKSGEKYTVKDLLYGLMLRSGNDAATALAIYVAGDVDSFVEMMNIKAEELGLSDTHFVNPHGLHDNNHYTSAYDLCKLGCYAMKNPLFKEIVSTKFVTVGEDGNKHYWANKNKILHNYPDGNGIKTGYTKKAGRCLVASAYRNGVQVVSVVLNRHNMFEYCSYLMDIAFDKIEKQ